MTESNVPEAWVQLPSEEELRPLMPEDHPYLDKFVPPMTRLLMTLPRIGAHFAVLFQQVMFEPGHLSRQEKEMVAAVAAAAQDCNY